MGRYIKVMAVIALFIGAIAVVGFKSSVNQAVSAVQAGLDKRTKDSAALIALSLNGVDIESEVELVESLIKGAYALGSFEEVTLYGKPTGENQNLKIQNKKDMGKDALRSSCFELHSQESLADIFLDGEVQGKILVKSDMREDFQSMQATVNGLMKLFAALGLGAVILMALIVKFILRTTH